MKLYEITNEFESVFNEINEDGELSNDLIEKLDSLQNNFEDKAVSLASYIKNIEAEETAISNAIEDMKLRKIRLTKKAQSLSDYLQLNLQKLSIKEIKKSPFFDIKLKQCPPSVEVIDESSIPLEFVREKVTTSIDKIKLKEALSGGIEVPGAQIQRKIKLEIK